MADQLLIGHAQRAQALFGELARLANGKLLAGLQHHLAGIGIDQIVDGLVAAETVGIERHAPAVLLPLVDHLAVEGVEDLLGIQSERNKAAT